MLRCSFKEEETHIRSLPLHPRGSQKSQGLLKSFKERTSRRFYGKRNMKKDYHKLLDQIIEYAVIMDEREKEKARNGKAEQTIGENWMVHHLRELKKLSEEE